MSSPASTAVAAARSDSLTPEANQLWQRVLSRLQLHAEQAHFDTYLRSTRGVAYDPSASVIRVAVANPFHVPLLEGKFSSIIHSVVADVVGAPIRVEFCPCVDGDLSPYGRPPREPLPPLPPLLAHLDLTSLGSQTESRPRQEIYGSDEPQRPRGNVQPAAGSPLNVRYTFQTFVVGQSNRLAHAASLAIVDHPGNAYNPLFLYGGVGLGKTHLLHAIGHAVGGRGSDVVYVSSETFTNELIESIRQHRTDDFRLKYRKARVLLIDDVQFIAGKERTEEEFFHTFNAIHESGGQIVLSSDRPPKATILEDRLRSRFECGLIADVQAPDYETRIAILRSKISDLTVGAVPSAVLDFIAQKVQSNIRELEGSLNRLLAHARHMQQPVTVELAAQALRDLVAPGPAGRVVTPEAILLAVGRYYGINSDELKGKSRHKQIVVPRQIAMYLLREDAHLSTPEIGRQLHRDHTTVLHGLKQVANDIARDGSSRTAVRGVRDVIASGAAQTAVLRAEE